MGLQYYPWFPGDYLRDTAGLSCEAHGCYRLLLDASFCQGPLPNDLSTLSRIAAGCPEGVVADILEKFWRLTEDGWINQRLEEVRQQVSEKQKKKSIGAMKTNWRRWGCEDSKKKLQKMGVDIAERSMDGSLSESLSDSLSDSLSESISSRNQNQNQNQIQRTKEVIETIDIRQPDGGRARLPEPSATKYSAEFLAWWDVYPKKAGKGAAFKAWKVAKKQASPEDLTRAAKAYAESEIVGDGFVKNPATWLNQGCWEDDPEAWKRAERRGTNGHAQRVEDLYPDLSRRGVTSGHGGGIA